MREHRQSAYRVIYLHGRRPEVVGRGEVPSRGCGVKTLPSSTGLRHAYANVKNRLIAILEWKINSSYAGIISSAAAAGEQALSSAPCRRDARGTRHWRYRAVVMMLRRR